MPPPLSRILYVEDEPHIQTVARLALTSVGKFTVEICSNGEEALKKAAAFKPDLFLLDVMMPGMDGPATLAALRAMPELASVPAIFMTAKVQPREVAQLESLGALGVIAKPFNPMALAGQINALWAKQDNTQGVARE